MYVPLEMMCARGNLYKKLLFDTVEWFWCCLEKYVCILVTLKLMLRSSRVIQFIYPSSLTIINLITYIKVIYFMYIYWYLIYIFIHILYIRYVTYYQWFLLVCTITNHILYNLNIYYIHSLSITYKLSLFCIMHSVFLLPYYYIIRIHISGQHVWAHYRVNIYDFQ